MHCIYLYIYIILLKRERNINYVRIIVNAFFEEDLKICNFGSKTLLFKFSGKKSTFIILRSYNTNIIGSRMVSRVGVGIGLPIFISISVISVIFSISDIGIGLEKIRYYIGFYSTKIGTVLSVVIVNNVALHCTPAAASRDSLKGR